MPSKLRRIRNAAIALTALGGAFVGVLGFAHTEHGRPLLRYLPGMGSSCPVQTTAMAPTERDRVRVETLASVRGEQSAGTSAALTFELGTTGRSDVVAWAIAHSIECRLEPSSALRCTDVPADALGTGMATDDVAFAFDAGDRLVAVDTSSRVADAETAARFVDRRTTALRSALGEPSQLAGEPTAAYVGRGALAQFSAEFRRAELRAKVIATNLGRGRFTVRELYQSIPG